MLICGKYWIVWHKSITDLTNISAWVYHIKFLFVLLASRKMSFVFWEWGKAALKYAKMQDRYAEISTISHRSSLIS